MKTAAAAIRAEAPGLPIVLGGISPIDSGFVADMAAQGVLDCVDAIVNGFPARLEPLDDPRMTGQAGRDPGVTSRPVWVHFGLLLRTGLSWADSERPPVDPEPIGAFCARMVRRYGR